MRPERDGSCVVRLSDLEEQLGARMRADATWRVMEGYLVATASASMLGRGADVMGDGAAAAEWRADESVLV